MEHNKTVNNEQNWLCKLKEFEELPVSWQSEKLTFFWKMPAYNFFIHKILYMSTILKIIQNRSSIFSLLNACVLKHKIDVPFLLIQALQNTNNLKLNSLFCYTKRFLWPLTNANIPQ